MKRPEGFDPQARKSQTPPVAPPTKPSRKPAAPQRPAASPHPAKAPTVHPSIKDHHEHPRVDEKAARRAVKAAARERRRFERHEVKRFTRRTRTKRALWMSVLAIVATLSIVLAVAIYSPILALREITVKGTSSLDEAEIVAAVDGQLGTPLALLDNARIERELSKFSLIRSFVTETVPPSTLVIHVVEREALGVVTNGERFDVIDAAGVVIRTVDERPASLPRITVAGEPKAGDVAFDSVVEVLLALPADLLERVGTVSASTKDDVTFKLSNGGPTVVWGSVDRSAFKARVLETLVAKKGNAAVKKYDVTAPDSVVISR
jgi:cell division protein FtsQ